METSSPQPLPAAKREMPKSVYVAILAVVSVALFRGIHVARVVQQEPYVPIGWILLLFLNLWVLGEVAAGSRRGWWLGRWFSGIGLGVFTVGWFGILSYVAMGQVPAHILLTGSVQPVACWTLFLILGTQRVRLYYGVLRARPAPQAPSARTETKSASPAWQCPACGEQVPPGFQVCWNCEAEKPDESAAADEP